MPRHPVIRLARIFILSCLAGLPFLPAAQPCGENELLKSIRISVSRGEFLPADKQVQQGLDCLEKTGNHAARFDFLLLRYELLRNQRKFTEALDAAKAAAVFYKKNQKGDNLSLQIALTEAYTWGKDKDNSLRFLREAQALVSPQTGDFQRAWLFYAEGVVHQFFTHKNEQSLTAYRQALAYFLRLPERAVYLEGQTLRNLGNVTRTQGDFKQALNYYEQELALYQKAYPATHNEIANTRYNLGAIHYELLNYQAALDQFLQCYEAWKNIHKPGSKYMRFLTEAIGDLYWELGDKTRALEFYDRSTVGEPPPVRDSAVVFVQSADMQQGLGKYSEALNYSRLALGFRERTFGKKHPLTIACRNYVARSMQSAGKTEEALQAYQQSILLQSDGFRDSSVLANPGREAMTFSGYHLLEALAGKGEILLARYEAVGANRDLDAAYETLQLAVGRLENLRQSPMSEASKQFWNQRCLPVLEKTIRAALHKYRLTQDESYLEAAFALSEKSKAFLLLAATQDERVAAFSGISSELVGQEYRLKNSILDYEGKINNEEQRCAEARQKQLELWRDKWRALDNEYRTLLDRIRREAPAYFNLKFGTETAELGALQKSLLTDHAALLEFFEGKEHVYLFLLDGIRIRVFDIPTDSIYLTRTSRLAELLPDLAFFLRNPAEAFQTYAQTAFDLYRLLLERPLQQCPATVERLHIVPDHRLLRIPFESLLTAPPNSQDRDYRPLAYLFRRYAISYCQSATLWQQAVAENLRRHGAQKYVGFAPDYTGIHYSGLPMQPAPLLFTQKEIERANGIFGGKTYAGSLATEHSFKSQAPGASVLHLATHVWLDDREPMLGKLLLLPADTTEDGLLHAFELYNMRLRAQLAILSACNTAAGNFEQGEGLMSLERGFQYAGCTALFSSLWTADDASASTLVGYFLENLEKGLPKDIALQQAQVRFLEESDPATALPFYWAGFRLAGDAAPLREGGGSYLFVGMMAVLVVVVGWLAYSKKEEG